MDMRDLADRRRSGLLIPLFSAHSTSSWGIGDIGDIPLLTAWLAAAGQRVLQLLPLNEMAAGQHSPYSAISAMAIDPIFIALPAVPEFASLGGEADLSDDERRVLAHVQAAPRIAYADIRSLKGRALQSAFARFLDVEWRHDTGRAGQLRAFLHAQAWWLDDYAVFRAIHAREDERPWTEWPEPLQRRESTAVDRARRELSREVLFYQYLQWVAHAQWSRARADAHGVAILGDLPFMVDADSADVWARQDQFQLDASLGAPPDAFSTTGQDWGMPVYRWDALARHDFEWVRERARRSADLYDGYRVDHLVGFYRTFGRSRVTGATLFTPSDPYEQRVLGERLLGILREGGAAIIAEDLGTVPDFVRESLARLNIPGFRVLRWERHWHDEGRPFRDMRDYPPVSVATTGTHDTEPLVVWWERTAREERASLNALPTIQQLTAGQGILTAGPDRVRDVLIEALFASGSNVLILPIQDVFGWRERINQPATVGEWNWTFRLPWPLDRLADVPDARERREALRRWAVQYQRI